MASISIELDTRRANARGEFPAKIIIRNNKTSAAISLGISVPLKSWLGNGMDKPVATSHPGAKIMNEQIQSLYIELRKSLNDLDLSGWTKNKKAAEIKERLLGERRVESVSDITFQSYANEFATKCNALGTKRNYIHTLNKLSEFAGDNLRFESITPALLRQFDDHLSKSGSGVNTRSIHFRNIRAIFNRAIDDDVVKQDIYPFRKFKIRSEQKNKESLTVDQVRALYEFDFKTESLGMARDCWMLSFFLCGINPIDLYYLKKTDGNNRISFVRTKTGHNSHDVIKLLIQPEAQSIIDRHKSSPDSEYLLKFESKYVSYEIFRSFLSKKIREIATITGFTGLTMYWARYSWATIADSIGIQEKIISKGLGHVDKSLAGRTYITFDWSRVDKANREIIDFVIK